MNRIALILAALALAACAQPPDAGQPTPDVVAINGPPPGPEVTGLAGMNLGGGNVTRMIDGSVAVYIGQARAALDNGDQVDVRWKAASPSTHPFPRAELAIAVGLPPLGEAVKLTTVGAVDVTAEIAAAPPNSSLVVTVPIDSRIQLEPGAPIWAVFTGWQVQGITAGPTYYTTNADANGAGRVLVFRVPGWWPTEHVADSAAFLIDPNVPTPVVVARAWSWP